VSLSIHVRSDNGAMVVALAGAADAAMLEPLRDPITAALSDAKVLVLDLDELSSLDPAWLRGLIIDVLGSARGGQLRVATSRAATFATLAEARIHHLVTVHHSVADALAATSSGDTGVTDQPLHQDDPVTFTVASVASVACASVSARVQCGACGRLHLPHRLRPLARSERALVLRCPRCGATGPLVIDPNDPPHLEILRSMPPSDDPAAAHR
jgi:anti-anti-sigma regulatory factor